MEIKCLNFFFAVVQELFYCHGLRKLSISDNEITSIPPAIASLDHLEELDFSKNGERMWGCEPVWSSGKALGW